MSGLMLSDQMAGGQVVRAAVVASGEGQFLGVDWGSFVVVFVAAFAATIAVVASYALGLRLLSLGGGGGGGGGGGVDASGGSGGGAHGSGGSGSGIRHRPVAATAGAWACFAFGVAAVLYGLYLIIPQFH
ncbi:hypothetical protein [Herbiconiux daphne]|uniref:Uncharacterized protein n=1 Tax=Herbiconiux daphne TaxID=2970914 RepID=A0ABT2H8A2_9MICO|nr:hypothetical protein [Herbiconiux daphne]MCS5736158.1 hypothetical protein [Herbiconiux daphne]